MKSKISKRFKSFLVSDKLGIQALIVQRRQAFKDLKPRSKAAILVIFLVLLGQLIYFLQPRTTRALGTISFVCASSAASTSTASCSGEQTGDLLLVTAFVTASSTAPTLATGFTSINTATNSGGSTSTRTALTSGWNTAASSTDGSGTWTGATNVIMQVYSGQGGSPIGNNATQGGSNSGTLVTYGADTLSVTGGSSWFAGFAVRNTADTTMSTAPTGMTNRTSNPATPVAAGFDTNSSTSSNWPSTDVTGFSVAAKFTSIVIEIKSNQPPGNVTPNSPVDGSIVTSTTPNLVMHATDPDGDAIKYKVSIYNTTAMSLGNCSGTQVAGSPWDQNVSGTGWDNGTTAYASGANATFTVQTTLTRGSSYCWQALAKDPSGTNTFGSQSFGITFTVNSPPVTPVLGTPASGATGVSATPAFTLSTSDNDIVWSQTGSSLSITSTGTPALAALSSTRVAFFDDTNDQLRTYDWSGTAWSLTGSGLSIAGAGIPALAVLSSTRVAYIDSANKLLQTYDWSGTAWSLTGSGLSIAGTGNPALAALSSTRVAFTDSGNAQLRAYDFSGTVWSQTGSSQGVVGGTPALTALSSTRVAYFSYPTSVLDTYDFSGTAWSLTGSGLSIAGAGNPALAALSSTQLAYIDYSNSQLRTYNFSGTAWSQTDGGLDISSVGSPALAALSSTQLAFIDATSQQLRTYASTIDYLQYRIYLYQSDCSTPVGTSPFAQASSQTGWSGQDANGGLAYNSGTTATYTYQATLSAGTTYCWKADALDPSGSNTYSSVSGTQLFTTAAGAAVPTAIQGGTVIQGGSFIQ